MTAPAFTKAEVDSHIRAYIAKHGKPPTTARRQWKTVALAVPKLFGCSLAELLRKDYSGLKS